MIIYRCFDQSIKFGFLLQVDHMPDAIHKFSIFKLSLPHTSNKCLEEISQQAKMTDKMSIGNMRMTAITYVSKAFRRNKKVKHSLLVLSTHDNTLKKTKYGNGRQYLLLLLFFVSSFLSLVRWLTTCVCVSRAAYSTFTSVSIVLRFFSLGCLCVLWFFFPSIAFCLVRLIFVWRP